MLDAQSGEVVVEKQLGGGVLSVAYSPDGSQLACGTSGDKKVTVLDAQSGEVVVEKQLGGDVNSVAYSPDGSQLAVAHMATRR